MARCVHPHRICIVSSALRQDKVTCRGAVKAHPADAPLIPYLAGVAHYSGPLQRRLAGSEMKKPTGLGRALLVAASHCACAHTLACGDFGGRCWSPACLYRCFRAPSDRYGPTCASACTFTKRLRTAYRLSNQRPCGGKAKALNLPAIRMRLSNFGGSYPPDSTINAFSWLVKRYF